jgi:hypothetical protein
MNMSDTSMSELISNYSSLETCIPQETTIKNVRLAAAYVPYQKLCTLLSPFEALSIGTAFPELYSPYHGKNKKAKPIEKR